MKKLIAKIFLAATLVHRKITRYIRRTHIQLMNPGCHFEPGVKICSGVMIQVTDGGTLSIGANTAIRENCLIIVKRGRLRIGKDGFVGTGSVICASESVEIGDYALIAEHVTIRDQNHGIEISEVPFSEQPMTTSSIKIGDSVWLGAKSTVLKGVEIGCKSVVGANAVVSKHVSPSTIVAGVPAKPIRCLEPEKLESST